MQRVEDALHYSRSLDGLRAVAAFTVALYHAKTPAMPGGFLGVDVFFVLSGYLITRLLLDEYRDTSKIDLRGFMTRRLRRLYPALLLFLAGYLAIAPFAFGEVDFAKHAMDAIWASLYVANYTRLFDAPMSVLGHVWSLGVEVQFYLIWPLAFLLLARLPRPWMMAAIGALYLLATGWRWWSFEFANPWLLYTRADTHCSGLLLGCLLACLNLRLHRYWNVVGIVALAFAVTFFSWPWRATAQIGFPIAEWAAALLIIAPPAWLGAPVLVWLGRISYGFYLWHYLIMRSLQSLKLPWHEVLLAGMVGGLICASLSYCLIERRFHSSRVRGQRDAGGGEAAASSTRSV